MNPEDIKRIKGRYEKDLMSLDHVVGVGIGHSKGDPSIVVFVDRLDQTQAIPATLDDVPVVIEESGPIEAL